MSYGRHECGGTIRRDRNESGFFFICRSCNKKVDAPKRTKGSGQIAGPCLYRQYKWKLSTRAKGAEV